MSAPSLERPDVVGVIGGLGPLATADFLRKLVLATPARRDQDHIPTLVWSWPQTPDRQAPIVRGEGASPGPWLAAVARSLVSQGARCLAMPCNAAHAWYDEVVAAVDVPCLHIVDAAAAEAPPGPLGVLATRATLLAELYPRRTGRTCLVPTEAELAEVVDPSVAAVKRGEGDRWSEALRRVVDRMLDAGAGAVVLACTELPTALRDPAGCVDSTGALARACVAWAMAQR